MVHPLANASMAGLMALLHAIRQSWPLQAWPDELDVLDDFEEIQVCSSYQYKGTLLTEFPAEIKVLEAVKPVYKSVPGWKSETVRIKDYSDLPRQAKDYVQLLSELTETEFSFISTSPEREDTIMLHDSWICRTFYG
jgi:adenylosuccinate synthase